MRKNLFSKYYNPKENKSSYSLIIEKHFSNTVSIEVGT